jgi:hypothetical protein
MQNSTGAATILEVRRLDVGSNVAKFVRPNYDDPREILIEN